MAKRARTPKLPPLQLQRFTGPLHRKIYAALREQILSRRLATGQLLPSSRVLAACLGVSRNTILAAYDRLAERGYIVSKVGSGTRVSVAFPRLMPAATDPTTSVTLRHRLAEMLQQSRYPLRHATFHDRDGNALYIYNPR